MKKRGHPLLPPAVIFEKIRKRKVSKMIFWLGFFKMFQIFNVFSPIWRILLSFLDHFLEKSQKSKKFQEI